MTGSLPFVSILMTAYNAEKYVGVAIQSVLDSDYKDFEFIFVDDCSKDETLSIANGYAKKDPRMSVHVNSTNLGDYPNRNYAASLARGAYLKYVDCDDYIYPWGIGELVGMMEAHPEAGWGLCSLPQDKDRPFPFVLQPREAYEYHYFGPGLFHKAPLSAIIRKTVFDAEQGFVPRRVIGDYATWHKFALKYPVLLMPEGIVWSREHEGQEGKHTQEYRIEYEEVPISYLQREDCPLPAALSAALLKKIRARSLRELTKARLRMDSKRIAFWKTWRRELNK